MRTGLACLLSSIDKHYLDLFSMKGRTAQRAPVGKNVEVGMSKVPLRTGRPRTAPPLSMF